MPEILPEHVPSPRTLLAWNGTAYRPITIDAAGRVQVRGEDQVFSFKGVLADHTSTASLGADGRTASTAVPVGTIWKVTNIAVTNWNRAITRLEFILVHDAVWYRFAEYNIARAAQEFAFWNGEIYADPDDRIYAQVFGSLVDDALVMDITGYTMTLEA